MTKASTNTDYHKAKLLIGEKEFNSEEYRIDSIKIQNGCYDGTIVGVGCVYGATANIVMENIDEVSIGQKIEIIFVDPQGEEKSFGKFWVKSYPVQDGDLMTLECHGAIGKDGDTPYYVPGMYQEFSMSIGEATNLISETSDIYVKWDIENPYAFTNRYYIDFPVQEDKFDPTNDANYAANIAPVSKREFLAGIAIKFGGNVVERDGYAYFTPKTPQNEEVFYFDEDSYSDLKISKERYGINSISLKYMPKYVNAEGTRVYRGTDRVTKAMLVSQTSGAGADVLYNQEVECDWVGFADMPSCFLQGDLSYRTGECVLVGYSDHLYPGNLVGILNNNEIIPFYIGEVTFDWDGGFVTTISCNCRVDVSGGTSSTSTSSSTSSAQINQSAQSAYNKLVFADITFSNIEDSTIRGSIFKDGTIDGSKIKDSTITGSLIADSTIKGSNIEEGTITGSKIKDATITGSKFEDGTIENSKIKDSTITGSKFEDGTIENSKIKDSTLTGAKIEDATIGIEKVNESFISDLTAKNAFIKNLTSTVAKINSLTAKDAIISNIFSKEIVSDKAILDVLQANIINAEYIKSAVADVGYITANEADLGYAKIDFSNVGEQVVGSSMIIDGAVTNEKVANLSANKITSGEIDANKVTVSNLNASNINTGTLTVGGVTLNIKENKAEIDGSDIKDGTVTLKGLSTEVKDTIDGAIETFTKSEIPTLNNEPASLWTDNETRKKHIGDVCYVLNPTSDADGYCYRFANTGTEESPKYEWVLIKDSDVTKALQDIIDINGEITGIKQFDTEISSWKTDTDSELSSLKLRTTTLETDMGSKVESSVFNELKQTVDENSSSITSLSTTVSKKADSSTVTSLTNTVNSVKQTADKNTLSISSMQTEIGKKADGSTVTELSQRTSNLEQNLDGFKTTVSETYTTKTEFDNLEIGGRNLLRDTKAFGNNGVLSTEMGYLRVGCNFGETYNGFKSRALTSSDKYTALAEYLVTDVQSGDVYTFSFWAKGSGIGTVFFHGPDGYKDVVHGIASTGDESLNSGDGYLIFRLTEEWTRYWITYTISSSTSNTETRKYLLLRNDNGADWSVCGLKLEKGNKATDWTPAPEDTEESITEVKTIAEQTADKFNWLVKSGTSATNFELTDRTATLVANHINLNGLVTFSGLNSDAQNKINSAENAVNNLEIGGRNLFSNSGDLSKASFGDHNAGSYIMIAETDGDVPSKNVMKITWESAPSNGGVFLTGYNLFNARIKKGDAVTVSIWCKCSSDKTVGVIDVEFLSIKSSIIPNISTKWQKYIVTGTANKDVIIENPSIAITFYYGNNMSVGDSLYLSSPKVEFGNKATDWSPAPEDTEKSINNVNAKAQGIIDNIYTSNTTTIDGGKITTGSIKAANIDVDNLFAQDITATGTITGATLKGTDAEITNGKIGNFSLSDGNFKFSNQEANLTLGKSASFGYGNYGLSIHDYRYSSSDYCAIFTAQALRIGESSKKGGNISFTTLLSSGHITTPEIIVDSIKCNGVYLGYKVISSGDFTCLKYDNGRLVIEYRSKMGNATSLTNISSEGVYYQLGSGGTFPVEFVDTPMVITGIGVPNLSAPFVNVSFDGVSKTGYNRCIFWATYSGAIIPANSVNSAIFIGRWDKL